MRKRRELGLKLNQLLLSMIAIILIVFVFRQTSRRSQALSQNKQKDDGYQQLASVQAPHKTWSIEPLPDQIDQSVGVDRYPIPQAISLSQVFGQGIGYRTGYTTLSMFFAPNDSKADVFPFLDIRGHYFSSDNTYATNLGVGGRYLPKRFPLILGLNSFYDYRKNGSNRFHQIGLGFELMGNRFGVQGNGYIPIGQQTHLKKCVFDDYVGGYIAINRQFASSFSGFNMAMSWTAVQKGLFSVDVVGGPYFLSGGLTSSVWGAQFSIQPRYSDYLSVALSVSHDPLFGTLIQGGVTVSLPLYRFSSVNKRKSSNGFSNRQIYQPVQRMEVMPLENRCCWETNF